MKDFFKVQKLEEVYEYRFQFPQMEIESIPIVSSYGRVLAEDVISDIDIPSFPKATMDGYAVRASSTYGASDGNPACLIIKGTVPMGAPCSFSINDGECARISTGGMLPSGADSVVMVEYAATLDEQTLEIYKSVAPGQHVIEVGEDFRIGETVLSKGQVLRSQDLGVLAALGRESVSVYKKPVVGIISTGDEIVPIHMSPAPGQIRDVNSYTLSGFIRECGGTPVLFGIIPDNYQSLYQTCHQAVRTCDMVLISGGSSVGMRDLTIEVLSSLPDSAILFHGIAISPGKPTILAKSCRKPIWGLPGHVTSAMVVCKIVVQPFIYHMAGVLKSSGMRAPIYAKLTRNIASAQGRSDFIRVKLIEKDGQLYAEPILGKSGLIHTMVKANGLIEIDINSEGLDKGADVLVIPV